MRGRGVLLFRLADTVGRSLRKHLFTALYCCCLEDWIVMKCMLRRARPRNDLTACTTDAGEGMVKAWIFGRALGLLAVANAQ